MVKSVKRTIKKCLRSNQKVSKGLLILRNSSLNCGLSRAELSMGRQLNDNLPKCVIKSDLDNIDYGTFQEKER